MSKRNNCLTLQRKNADEIFLDVSTGAFSLTGDKWNKDLRCPPSGLGVFFSDQKKGPYRFKRELILPFIS